MSAETKHCECQFPRRNWSVCVRCGLSINTEIGDHFLKAADSVLAALATVIVPKLPVEQLSRSLIAGAIQSALGGTCEVNQQLVDALKEYTDQLAKREADLEQAVEDRDTAQDSLQDCHVAMGGDGEWVAKLPPRNPPESGDLTRDVPVMCRLLMKELTRLESQRTLLVDALKAARPLLIGALAFVDCKRELAQLDAALKMAEE